MTSHVRFTWWQRALLWFELALERLVLGRQDRW